MKFCAHTKFVPCKREPITSLVHAKARSEIHMHETGADISEIKGGGNIKSLSLWKVQEGSTARISHVVVKFIVTIAQIRCPPPQKKSVKFST